MKDKENNIYAKVKMFCKDSIWSIAVCGLPDMGTKVWQRSLWKYCLRNVAD